MTYFQILSVCLILTYFMAHFKEALWAIVTVAAWWAMMGYTITNPPGGVTTGSFVHTALMLIFLSVGISCGAWYFFSEKKRKLSSMPRVNSYSNYEGMDSDEADYRATVRSALHPRRRND